MNAKNVLDFEIRLNLGKMPSLKFPFLSSIKLKWHMLISSRVQCNAIFGSCCVVLYPTHTLLVCPLKFFFIMSLRLVLLWPILLLLTFGQAAVLYTNSTTSATPASTVLGSAPSTITPSTTLSYANVESTTELFPVTSGPYWGNQTIPINTCTSWNLGGVTPQLVWTPYHMYEEPHYSLT
ncbi:hypothetical protein OCU04_003870 [Sclerotinia nivalis]|uniref:Uncharacterized protein n=1 Tax=Sclerotinia nivalis TaxID=352851 RepID=A0A9X0AST7_9HELO|nr:hypothetical protein OCU04_003870 [Sclerotinia nivalis]